MARWSNCLFGLPGKEPLRVLHCRSRALNKELLANLRNGDYDLLHVDRFRLAPYAFEAKQLLGNTPVVLDFPDALSLYYERAIENPRHWAKGWVDRREHRVIPPYEARVLDWNLECVVCSEIDRSRLLSTSPGARVHVVPNMVDVREFVPQSRPRGNPQATFSGTLYYLPNIDGLLWLKDRIMPLLGDFGPQVEVLGYGATSELDPVKKDPRFTFRGYVENMAAHLFREDIYLCPLRVGAGVRFKLLEAFAAGMATVSTTLGYEGIPCTAGEHLLVADTEREFADAIRFLLDHPQEKERIGNKAREFAVQNYSVEAAGQLLEGVYSDSL